MEANDEKGALLPLTPSSTDVRNGCSVACKLKRCLALAAFAALAWYHVCTTRIAQYSALFHGSSSSGWGRFPRPDDPFHLLPCTNATFIPQLEDAHALETWTSLYDDDRTHWSYANSSSGSLYLCGYLDVPLDYTNASDKRIARLAITRLQHAPTRTSRTLVVEPGGPGGSGTNLVWRKAQLLSHMYTNDTMDVLGWDPRGVNASLPSISCFPYDADRDRWSLLTSTYYREANPRESMMKADAINQAILDACYRKYADVGQMMSTAFVARDLDEIRKALGHAHLDGYFVSYGTGIGQTYVNMFPDRVGRLMLDGTEYVRDQRLLGGFGWAALDNITAAFHDGFLGECVAAGAERCALARPLGPPLDGNTTRPPRSRTELIQTMDDLFARLVQRPIPGWTPASGPLIITYSQVISIIYSALYDSSTWDSLATALYELLQGNSSLMSRYVDSWEYDPWQPSVSRATQSSDELAMLVICSDQYDSALPDGYEVATNGEQWYLDLWKQMVSKSEIGGNSRFLDILPCRHWNATFGSPKEVYRGDLNHSLSNPVLLIAESYDPATPLRNGRRLLTEMGHHNARLIALAAFSHSSRDLSKCAIDIMRSYMLDGILPHSNETKCKADRSPYTSTDTPQSTHDMMHHWHAHMAEMRSLSPRLGPRLAKRRS